MIICASSSKPPCYNPMPFSHSQRVLGARCRPCFMQQVQRCGLCRYFVPNPAAKGKGWFGMSGAAAPQTLDPGFAGQQSMLKSAEHPITAKQQIRLVAKTNQVAPMSPRSKGSRISHDAEWGRRTSDDVQPVDSAQLSQPKELELLKGVSGYAVPGKLMALMGGSGAGEYCSNQYSLLLYSYVTSAESWWPAITCSL